MARLTQEEMDRRLAEVGGGRLVHAGTAGKRKVPNPAYNKYDPASTETIELDVQQWKSPDGHTIQAVQMPDGTWDVSQDEPPPPKPAQNTGTSTTSPRVPAGSIPRIEGTPILGQPGQFDNSQPIRAWHAPDGSVVYEALTPAERQQWEREKNGGRTDAEIAGDAREQASRPGTKIGERTEVKNGRRVTVERWRLPNGTEEDRVKDEPEPVKPRQVVSTSYDPQTGAEITKYDDGTETRKEAKPEASAFGAAGAPQYTPDFADPSHDLGLNAYKAQLQQWVTAQGNTPQARATAAQLMTQAGATATQASSRENLVAGRHSTTRSQDITQRGQDIQEVQSRRSSAGGGFDTLFNQFSGQGKYLGRGRGDLAAEAFFDALDARDARARAAGGYADIPRVAGPPPAYLGTPSTDIRIAPGGAVSVSPAGAPALPPEGNALGLGAIGDQPAPGGAAPAAATTSSPPMRDDWRMDRGVNPPAGEPGNNPALPVGMSGPAPAYLGGRPPFDPAPIVADLRARGIPDDIIQEALDEHNRGGMAA